MAGVIPITFSSCSAISQSQSLKMWFRKDRYYRCISFLTGGTMYFYLSEQFHQLEQACWLCSNIILHAWWREKWMKKIIYLLILQEKQSQVSHFFHLSSIKTYWFANPKFWYVELLSNTVYRGDERFSPMVPHPCLYRSCIMLRILSMILHRRIQACVWV